MLIMILNPMAVRSDRAACTYFCASVHNKGPLPPMDGTFFLMLHSVLRYALILLLLASIAVSLRGLITKAPILVIHRTITVWTVIAAHIQLVLGLILYFIRGSYALDHSTAIGRFWKMEHIGMMVIAIASITIGRVLSKKATDEYRKQLHIAVFFVIAMLLILAAIPWPFLEIGHGRGWI